METEQTFQRIHFIGIGGVGMSGIALVAASRGLVVTGSDLKESRTSRMLTRAGIKVFIGHDVAHVEETQPQVVVVSSAIPASNPELVAARERGIEVWPRAKMLAHLGKGSKTLAVAGTHGKTTTSSMLATSLSLLDADPTFLIGGVLDAFDTNARAGSSEYFVIEADESDGSFTYLDPYVAIVTNIEEDHLDHYPDLKAIEDAFVDFMSAVPAQGAMVVCGDYPHLPLLVKDTGKRVITYGLAETCDVRCIPTAPQQGADLHAPRNEFAVEFPDGMRVSMNLNANPGIHNAVNATGVMAALWFLGFDRERAAQALCGFSGVRRRFDHVGNVDGIEIVDDYGHHPTEVKATIKAACELGYDHVHVLFQPHRYTRTEALAKQWGEAFDLASSVTFMDVYSAGEAPIPGINGKTLVDAVLLHDARANIAWLPHRVDVVPYLISKIHSGDLLITMGAGDVTTIGPLVVDELEKRSHLL